MDFLSDGPKIFIGRFLQLCNEFSGVPSGVTNTKGQALVQPGGGVGCKLAEQKGVLTG